MNLAHAFVVAIAEVLPVIEHERQRGGSRELRLGIGELEDPGEHRIHDDGALVEIEDEELPPMSDTGEAAMRERRLDRFSRPQHCWVADAHEDDLAPNERLLKTPAHDVKIGPLRH